MSTTPHSHPLGWEWDASQDAWTIPSDEPRAMTPERLRTVAAWLDTYDAFARRVAPHLNRGCGEITTFTEVVSGSAVQDDLRRWADEIEAAADA